VRQTETARGTSFQLVHSSSCHRPEIDQADRLDPRRLDAVDFADAFRFPYQLALDRFEPALPVSPVRGQLAFLVFEQIEKRRLVRFCLPCCLGDGLALILEAPSPVLRFLLAPLLRPS